MRIETLGCRLNIGEMETLARELAGRGHRVVGPGEPADLCVVNTCTVTATAARKSRHLARQLRATTGGAPLVATGCWTEMAAAAAHEAGVDLVVANRDKDRIAELLEERGLLDATGEDGGEVTWTPGGVGRTRAFLKVQDGCDNRCSFCIVTVARGGGRSRPAEAVLGDVRELVADGYREVVLSGVHLGSYGHDHGDRRGLERLVRLILSGTALERLRLSSLEPWDLDARFLDLLAEPRLQPHLHLPLQSGCDDTLRRMARRGTTADLRALAGHARRVRPEVAISTDVMVGFPGETDAEFERSITTVAELGFSRLHVFRYSRREGARAAAMPCQVPGPVATERSRRMLALGAELEARFHRGLVGGRHDVLWETAEPFGDGQRWSGLTGSYVRVLTETPAGADLENRVTPATVVEVVAGGVLGEVDGISVGRLVEPAPRPDRALPVVAAG